MSNEERSSDKSAWQMTEKTGRHLKTWDKEEDSSQGAREGPDNRQKSGSQFPGLERAGDSFPAHCSERELGSCETRSGGALGGIPHFPLAHGQPAHLH